MIIRIVPMISPFLTLFSSARDTLDVLSTQAKASPLLSSRLALRIRLA